MGKSSLICKTNDTRLNLDGAAKKSYDFDFF